MRQIIFLIDEDVFQTFRLENIIVTLDTGDWSSVTLGELLDVGPGYRLVDVDETNEEK